MKDKKSVSFYEDSLSEEVTRKINKAGYLITEQDGQFKVTYSFSDMTARNKAVAERGKALTAEERTEMLEKFVWIRLQDDIRKDMRANVGLAESGSGLTREQSKFVAGDVETQEFIKRRLAEKKAQSK